MKPETLLEGRYAIKAMAINGTVKAVGLLADGQKRRERNAVQSPYVAEAVADTAEAAISEVRRSLAAREAKFREARQHDIYTNTPIFTEQEYVDAFLTMELHPGQISMLVGHAKSEVSCLSSEDIAKFAGYNNFGGANLHYGMLGGKLADALRVQPGNPKMAMMAEVEQERDTGLWLFDIRPEVAAAVKRVFA